jgi:hypothetical protein
MPVTTGLFDTHSDAIRALPERPLTERDLLTNKFLLKRQKRPNLSVYYAPLDCVNRKARVVIVGITPGWQQMRLAFEAAHAALARGASSDTALKVAKEHAAFAGSMRTNLCKWLDDLRLPECLGVPNTAALFSTRAALVHSTSAVRYPVFRDGKNYTGGRPPLARTPFLLDFAQEYFVPELLAIGDPIIVPLGVAVEKTLRELDIGASRCLYGFPHPSGGYPGGPRKFAEARRRLRAQVATL